MKLWDNLFKKPPPVDSREDWAASPDYLRYIYLPNLASGKGNDAEDYYSNSLYTRVMLEAYQLLCQIKKVNPAIKLFHNDNVLRVMALNPMDGLQMHTVGERAARLANSKLVEWDDGSYAEEFLLILQSLLEGDPEDKSYSQAKQTVLAKCEVIITGKVVHISNGMFVSRFLDLIGAKTEQLNQCFGSDTDEIVSHISLILRSMVEEGAILASGRSETEFQQRIYPLTRGKGNLVDVYREAGKYD